MNWFAGIANEMKIMFRMTFVDPVRAGKLSDPGWFRDPHLRKGFILGLPLFLVPVVAFFTGRITFWWVFPFVIGANLVHLGYAAWSRARSLNGIGSS
jgi:hypothetical protein